MGITIHFKLKTSETSEEKVRALIEQLHSAAQDLSFAAVGEIIELVGEQCLHQPEDSEDLLIMKIQAVAKTIDEGKIREYQCDRIIGFTVYPGQGCEFLSIFLAHYPSLGNNWQSRSFCQTQFAASLSIPHFIICHTAIISLLDKASALEDV
jgi:hypothetical protein